MTELAHANPSAKPSRDPSVEIFLLETWETLRELDRALEGRLDQASTDSARVLAHRIRGSASLQGLGAVSESARSLEELLEQPTAGAAGDRGASTTLGAAFESLVEVMASLTSSEPALTDEPALTSEPPSPDPSSLSESTDAPATVVGEPLSEEREEAVPGAEIAEAPSVQLEAGGMVESEAVTGELVLPEHLVPAKLTVPQTGPVEEELRSFFETNSEALSYFRPEVEELLDEVATLLERPLTDDGTNSDSDAGAVHRLFRAFHTIKGSSFIVGCVPLGDLAHRAEEHLSCVRESGTPLDRSFLRGVHRLATTMLWMDQRPTAFIDGELEALSDPQTDPTDQQSDQKSASEPAATDTGAPEQEGIVEHVAESTESTERDDTEQVDSILATPAEELDLDIENASDQASLDGQASSTGSTTDPEPAPRFDVVAAQESRGVADLPAQRKSSGFATLRAEVARVDSIINGLGEITSQKSQFDLTTEALSGIRQQVKVGQRRITRFAAQFERRVRDLGAASPATTSQTPAGFGVGEFEAEDDLELLSRQISEIANDLDELGANLDTEISMLQQRQSRLQKVTATLRSDMGRLRMIPMSRVFARLQRSFESARASLPQGVDARFEAKGESAEVDNAVFEGVFEALEHVLRNALVHGIESADEREKLGKDAVGTISIEATQTRSNVRLEIRDDGRGIDLQKVVERAVGLGLRTRQEITRMDPARLWELTLLPGLTTRDTIDHLAGRGVGMDVVANRVRALGAELDVRTEPGQGTTFVFDLPLTLVVSDVLVVETAGRGFAFPSRRILKVLPCKRERGTTAVGREITVDGDTVPLRALEGLLSLDRLIDNDRDGDDQLTGAIVVLRTSTGAQAIEVDRVHKIEEVVLRNLGDFLSPLQYLQGAFLGDSGDIVLVLNPDGLTALHEVETQERTNNEQRAAKALLVDDSVSVRRVVGDLLRGLTLDVTTASDGVLALAAMDEDDFDYLLTDLEMPNMHGYELIERVRARNLTIPIVVMSTRVSDKHREASTKAGANAVLAKPVAAHQLSRALGLEPTGDVS